jgi:hypothetical protein
MHAHFPVISTGRRRPTVSASYPPHAALNQSRDKSDDCATRTNDEHGCHTGFKGAIKGIVREKLDRPIASGREHDIADWRSKQRH